MKILLCAATATLAITAAGSAAAQDADNWSGVYVGGHVGYSFQPDNDDETILFDNNLDGAFNDTVLTAAAVNAFSPGFCGGAATGATPAGGCDDDSNGIDFGARMGVDWQMGSGLVLGLVGEVSRPAVEDSVSAFSTTPAFYTMTREVEWMAAARARAGFAMGGGFLPYVTGGFAWAQVDSTFATSNAVNTFVQSEDDNVSGYQVGGGIERAMGPRWRLGLEYLYTSLDDGDFRVRAQGPAPANNPFILVNPAGTDFARSDDNLDIHSVRLTAAWRF